jgi:hypothetical protein
MNGSASTPSSATTKGIRCAISPEMQATSRQSRSSLLTRIGIGEGAGKGNRCREPRPPRRVTAAAPA